MDGWKDAGTDGWMDAQIDGWLRGCVEREEVTQVVCVRR
jgi:hypothetical protein